MADWKARRKITMHVDRVQKELTEAEVVSFKEVAKRIRDDAASLCPKNTGTNAKSLVFWANPSKRGVHAGIASTSGYGGYIEVGTGTRGYAQPYIYPALKRHQAEVGRVLSGKVRLIRGGSR